MAAEVAISCGDPTEAQLACAAVTQAVDDSGASGHLTLLDQVCTMSRTSSVAIAYTLALLLLALTIAPCFPG